MFIVLFVSVYEIQRRFGVVIVLKSISNGWVQQTGEYSKRQTELIMMRNNSIPLK